MEDRIILVDEFGYSVQSNPFDSLGDLSTWLDIAFAINGTILLKLDDGLYQFIKMDVIEYEADPEEPFDFYSSWTETYQDIFGEPEYFYFFENTATGEMINFRAYPRDWAFSNQFQEENIRKIPKLNLKKSLDVLLTPYRDFPIQWRFSYCQLVEQALSVADRYIKSSWDESDQEHPYRLGFVIKHKKYMTGYVNEYGLMGPDVTAPWRENGGPWWILY